LKLIQRFGYYFGGFAIGLVLLAFFLNGKRVSCDYGPEARVLKNINSKPLVYSKSAKTIIFSKAIDSSVIHHIMLKGDVNFSESDTRKEPCGIFNIEGDYKDTSYTLIVENCETSAQLLDLIIKN
jgi:hypothetical protein